MKGINSLQSLLARQNQRFICIDTGWPESGLEKFTAGIVHYADPPLATAQVDQLKRLFPDIPQLAEFYSHFGSIRLYLDPIGGDSAFRVANPDEWHGLKKDFKMWLDLLTEDQSDFLPDWIEDYIAIGEIPRTGNYYLMPYKGPSAGKVFEFEHDGFEFTEEGVDLSSFLQKISTVNDALIQHMLGQTCYSDGETDTQWLADEYRYDH